LHKSAGITTSRCPSGACFDNFVVFYELAINLDKLEDPGSVAVGSHEQDFPRERSEILTGTYLEWAAVRVGAAMELINRDENHVAKSAAPVHEVLLLCHAPFRKDKDVAADLRRGDGASWRAVCPPVLGQSPVLESSTARSNSPRARIGIPP
jgi:hypothetical protein